MVRMMQRYSAGLSIDPVQAWRTAIHNADYVTEREGGKGAVMDACIYIMNKMGSTWFHLE
jgi:3-deoxy-D-manno-octulosonate 8-phosphate phosphatase KdsC-like HAD superfamily phosphatase